MADIPEQPAAWPEIPLIAKTDRVMGGLEGAANRQAVKMLQRMQMVKEIGDTASTAISTMAPLVAQARSGADAALLAAQAAQSTADIAGDDASAAHALATAAQSAAANADGKAVTAQTAAAAAATAASTADGKAVTAQATAEAADTKATNAQTKANQADGKATAAQNKADQADTKATNAQSAASSAGSNATAAMTAANAKATRVDLGAVSLTYSAVLALGAGARSVAVNCTGAQVGDAIFVAPTGAVPDGYAVGAAQCLVADVIRVSVVHPALVLGASFTIPLRVFALR